MLKATLQKREQGECIIADLLDLDPEEYEAIQTSAAAAQQAAEQAAEESDDDNSVMSGMYDGPFDEATPPVNSQYTAEAKQALVDRLFAGVHRGAVSGEYLSQLFEALLIMKDQALIHTRRKPVTSRPKLIFGLRNNDGDLPLYMWGQSLCNYGTIGDMLPVLEPLFAIAADICPEARGHNAIMLTFYHNGRNYYIPPHRDAAYSVNSEGEYEDSTPIVFFSFGVSRKFVITDLQVPDSHHMTDIEPHSILTLDLSHGDMFILNGSDNPNVKHCLPADDTAEIRTVQLAFSRLGCIVQRLRSLKCLIAAFSLYVWRL